MTDTQIETRKKCVGCRELIDVEASICPHCGTRQSQVSRNLIRFTALAGALTTILSLATAGVALLPQALSV
ncbi:hypothetical protein J7443_07755 [Tropicibacter sp. R15_0]|uniref:hypothetical protein n=1 Tax=Tropicibacter sp. R15_0 TaxID=2821101 RepID=UPI001ADC9964|nr:hypothetical protein [Tropicibacter sp. R15_0]MBO9465118.1 hypothetical protein [Tropicibacter sp. R15_0]